MDAGIPSALRSFLDVVDRLGLRYAVGGSVAASVHGEPRTTHDTDVLVELDEAQRPAFVEGLRETFYIPESTLESAVRSCTSFGLVHLDSGHKIDVFVAGNRLLDHEQLEQRVAAGLIEDAPPVFVTSAEILVLRKLDWFRSGGEVSERQWRDVLGILVVQRGRLDENLLGRLATELGLDALLRRAIDEAKWPRSDS